MKPLSPSDGGPKVAVVDYGLGNLGSVLKGLRHAGVEAVLTGDVESLSSADALVLPGDGAFSATMDEICSRGLEGPLLEAAASGKPILGICIGMQVLFEESEEHGLHRGLGLLPGRVVRIPGPLAVPHMGWNRLRRRQPHPLFDGVPDGAYVYFVHSYYCDAGEAVTLATTDYGIDLAAVVGSQGVVGVQFHPEKSQGVGLRLLGNWASWLGLKRPSEAPTRVAAGGGAA